MKRLLALLFFVGFIAPISYSQLAEGDVRIIQNYFGMEKAALVQEYMELSPEQDSVFWPVYAEYELERQELGRQRIALIDEYVASVLNLTEDEAIKLVDQANDLEIAFRKLSKKYFTQLSKKIGPVKAAQFFQFENYLHNVINLSIQESIPFVGELEEKHDQMPKKK